MFGGEPVPGLLLARRVLGPDAGSGYRQRERILGRVQQPVGGVRAVQVVVEDPVDGGMPQHGHGLPTQPRVTRTSADGLYEIEGLRFSMGGWWEVKLAIDSPAGKDNVTFNLSL